MVWFYPPLIGEEPKGVHQTRMIKPGIYSFPSVSIANSRIQQMTSYGTTESVPMVRISTRAGK
jgi:hypothetical protein